jgi:hypothetical protein
MMFSLNVLTTASHQMAQFVAQSKMDRPSTVEVLDPGAWMRRRKKSQERTERARKVSR